MCLNEINIKEIKLFKSAVGKASNPKTRHIGAARKPHRLRIHVNKIILLLHVATPHQENAGSFDRTLTDLGSGC